MTESKFKVGDRVCFYHGGGNEAFRTVGIIKEIKSSSLVAVMVGTGPNSGLCTVHPKQCRRLVKKKGKLRAALEKIKVIGEKPFNNTECCGECGFDADDFKIIYRIAKEALEGK